MSQWDNTALVALVKIRKTCAKCRRKSTVIIVMNKVEDDGTGEVLVFCSCNVHANETLAELRDDPRMAEVTPAIFANEGRIRAVISEVVEALDTPPPVRH